MKYDEATVVEGLRSGDATAYRAMVQRFTPSLYTLIYAFVNHHDDANTLLTHTFEDACLKIEYYKPTSKFSTWLFSIGKYNCIDFLRTKKRRIEAIAVAEPERVATGLAATPEEIFIRNQQMEMIERAISKFKPKVQIAVREFYFEGLQYDEIAEKYQEPSSSIRVRVLRARKHLRKQLTKTL